MTDLELGLHVRSCDFATLMGSGAASQPAYLTTAAAVKLLHDFPFSKVSQGVTNQQDLTTIERPHFWHEDQRARCLAQE